MKTKVIMLNKKFNERVSTRAAVQNLFNDSHFTNCNQVVLDFRGIRFLSSSAAHQIFLETKNLKNKNIDIKLENVNENVHKMLSLSSKDRKNLFTILHFDHEKVSSSQELDKFLLGD